MNTHFRDKDALSHVVEKRIAGYLALSESHGIELPGHLSSCADALREGSLFLLMTWLFLSLTGGVSFPLLLAAALALIAWKTGRSAWLGYARMERLHRVMEEERYEIEHNRDQERMELKALYRAKGFEGQLLDDVIDVLMADNDRLLRVMLEEELGLTLSAYDHPLKQASGAFFGSLLSVCLLLPAALFFPPWAVLSIALFSIGCGGAFSASFEKNAPIPAFVWNLSIAGLSLGIAYFIFRLL